MSDKATFTPGPFRYEAEEREVVTYLGIPLCEVFDTAEGLEGTDGEADANGRLFAAAPDMLAALKAWQALRESTEDGTDAVGEIARVESMMRAAIAKATDGG